MISMNLERKLFWECEKCKCINVNLREEKNVIKCHSCQKTFLVEEIKELKYKTNEKTL